MGWVRPVLAEGAGRAEQRDDAEKKICKASAPREAWRDGINGAGLVLRFSA